MASNRIIRSDHQHKVMISHPARDINLDHVSQAKRSSGATSSRDAGVAALTDQENDAVFWPAPARQMPAAAATGVSPANPAIERLDPAVTTSLPSQALLSMENKKQNAAASAAASAGRRKSSGSGAAWQQQALRSPVVKRPPSAPVSLQGWLHKQGSEGLMLWKKRWFVLSEYCLFYYKSPEEEKLLGSILLPSYKISPCASDERVFRKFCFKAEHANMRTYYFAADTRELMVQWMNALSLASILQEGINWDAHRSGRPSVSSFTSLPSNDDSDSGFHGYKSRSEKKLVQDDGQPINSHDSSVSNGWGAQKPIVYQQPLYANAPPKPRRLADREGMSSPEPLLDKRVDGAKTPDAEGFKKYSPKTAQPQQPVTVRSDRSGGVDVRYHYQAVGQTPLRYQPHDMIQTQNAQILVPNSERRTPDTYGRSNSTTPGSIKAKGVDYEDVYNNREPGAVTGQLFRRPSGQVAFIKGSGPPIPFPQNFPIEIVPGSQYGQSYYRYPGQQAAATAATTATPSVVHAFQPPTPSQQSVQPARQKRQQPPRPHSADFLEYDTRRYYEEQVYQQRSVVTRDSTTHNVDEKTYTTKTKGRLPRPKSSLDVIAPGDSSANDYFWSEESYAQKMRQSASYVHTPTRGQPSSRATTPSVRMTTPLGVSGVEGTPVGGVSSGGSIASEVFRTPKRTDVEERDSVTMRSSSQQQHYQQQQQQQQQQQRRWSEYGDSNFMRSASARLPRNRYEDDENEYSQGERQRSSSDVRDGEKKIQQREESMKRLLEWKQRMLQSPLTRKPSGSSTRGTAQNELSKYYKQQVLRELANQEARSRDESRGLRRRSHQEDGRVNLRSRSQDGRRSSTSLNRYNSYSSDDEELGEEVRKGRKRVRRPSQAGRSSRRPPPNPATPDYENIALVYPKTNPNVIIRGDVKDPRELRNSPRPEAIRPDVPYGVDYHLDATPQRHERPKSELIYASRERKIEDNYMPIEIKTNRDGALILPLKAHKSNTSKGEVSLRRLGNGEWYPAPDDNCSLGKHSDSGYDTLQIGNNKATFPGDLLKLQRTGFDAKMRVETVCPVQEVKWDKDDKTIEETILTKEISYQYVTPGKDLDTSSKKVESPPKNIVQNRIKAFEDEGIVRVATNVNIKMQEPLKMSPPMYQPTEAHVSNLRNAELLLEEGKAGQPDGKTSLDSTISSPEDGAYEIKNRRKASKETDKKVKSVKDLLADFERKSKLVKERQFAEEERSNEGGPGKRFVFSDTETLLYDTSSDTEGQEDKKTSLPIHIRQRSVSRYGPTFSDDDDKDEEVAAALGKSDKFYSSCRDMGRSRDLDFPGERRRKRKTSKAGSSTASGNADSIVTPGYLRLSMSESLVTPDDDDSVCCTPTNSSQRTEIDIAIDEAVNTTESEMPDNPEEYYMPMTPSRKAVLAPPDAFKNHSALMENIFGGSGVEAEESSYVEMTENGLGRSLLAPDSSQFDFKRLNSSDSNATYATPESPRYCEIGKGNSSHYELMYKASTQYEPVYMEVSPLLDILKTREEATKGSGMDSDEVKGSSDSTLRGSSGSAERLREEALDILPPTPPRTSLPDICGTSAGAPQKASDRDSSDADDEASKDLDCLDAPRHPRFSLSDTFRPASYYLGASSALISPGPGVASEHQDSSDSDLVSPPPIPKSPPPLEELETSLELHDSSLDMSKSLSFDKSLGDNRSLWSKTPFPKSSSDSEAVELRHPEASDRRSKRRPVSDDLIESLDDSRYLLELSYMDRRSGSDLDSIGSRSRLAMDLDDGVNIDLDRYLEGLQSRDAFNVDLYSKDHNYGYYRSYQDMYGLNENYPSAEKVSPKMAPSQKSASIDGQVLSLAHYPLPLGELDVSPQRMALPPPHDAEEALYENLQMILPPPPEHASDPSDQDISSGRSSLGSHRRTDSEILRASLTREGDDDQPAGAPYYYSDLLKTDEEAALMSSASERSLSSPRGYPNHPPLPGLPGRSDPRVNGPNNLRGDTERNLLNRRHDVGRKVNAINQSFGYPRHQRLSSEDESRLLAEELRTTTEHFLDAADKRGQVDQRNLYEADTLQRRKPKSPEERLYHVLEQEVGGHPTNAINLYPHGLRDKSMPSTSRIPAPEFSGAYQRRSRSLEGLLDDPEFLQRTSMSANLATSMINVPQSATARQLPSNASPERVVVNSQRAEGQTPRRPVVQQPCEGDDLWEEDTLWRESLRRVSLRHTRSLDNLDGGRARSQSRQSNASAVTESMADQSSGRRSVDILSAGRKINREVTYVNDMVREHPPGGSHEYEEDYREGRKRIRRKPTPDDVRDDGVHYERLSRYSESLERTRRGQTYLEEYVWDEDRETFRKDEQSGADGVNLQTSEGTQQAFLEDGSLPAAPAPQTASFEIDREKLRQWDLMSSAPLRLGRPLSASRVAGVALIGEGGRQLPPNQARKITQDGDDNLPPSSTASGSGSVIGRDPLPPRSISSMAITQPIKKAPPAITVTADDKALQSPKNVVVTQDPGSYRSHSSLQSSPEYRANGMSLDSGNHSMTQSSGDYRSHVTMQSPGDRSQSVTSPSLMSSPSHNIGYNESRDASISDRTDTLERKEKKPRGGAPWNLTVSAGELLGRTHEELVLLLIQLRRQSAGVCKAMETCHIEIEAQARLAELETPKRLEHLQRLEDLKRQLLDLEKQYEKGKPLVNLVDNMVKLGSLYRGTGTHLQPAGSFEVPTVRERLEFNQKVQEQRLLAEERKDWDRFNPDHGQLQAKVQELYRLDRLLQEESGTLQSLQQDKELLEKALGGLRHKLQGSRSSPAEAERYRKQQRLLERELSRVRMLLAHNSKKLEETVAENARLEQELVVLRQKLQASRRSSLQHPALQRSSEQASATTAALEAELRRVQQLVGDLQRQRQELSVQVRQLTEKSHNLVQQIRPGPTGVTGADAIPGRKRHHTTWLETDLDSLVTLDHGLESPASPPHSQSSYGMKMSPDHRSSIPLYVNADKARHDPSDFETTTDEDILPPPIPAPPELPPDYPPPPPPPPKEEIFLNTNGQYQTDISEADDRMKRFYGIIPREKQQEIKTVRIVKREAERRQKERDRSGNIGIPIVTNGSTLPKRLPIPDDILDTGSQVIEVEQMIGIEDDPVLMQFQRSMSLPRGFGSKGRPAYQQPPPPPVRVPSPRSDSHTALRNLMIARHRVRFESGSGGSSSGDSVNSQRTSSPCSNRGLTAHEQLFGANFSSDSPQLSPVFKSEAARAIVMEMATMREDSPMKRAVPKEKRRHHTVTSGRPLHTVDSSYSIMGSARSRDDLDMERALRPRINAPDVVRSTMGHKDFKYNENTIDSILGTPNKILIPERYIPEQAPELSVEEQQHRYRKAESIRKMLSETSSVSTPDLNDPEEEEPTSTLKKKVLAEKRQREHLLQLNQILAKQVMEKSKMVAVKALATLPLTNQEPSFDDEDLSPVQPLPLYQQRDNFYS